MFTVEQKTENGFDKIILKDNSTNTFAEIIPSCGAILHAFVVMHENNSLNVIDSYTDTEDFYKNLTAKGFKGNKLSPFVCRINNAEYKFANKTYHPDKFTLNGASLHGLLYDAVFEVISKTTTEENATTVLQHQYRGYDKGYPFHYDCIITYQLQKENSLVVSTKVINKSNASIPIQDGWHPYFTFGNKIDDLQLEFQAKEKVEFDEKLIPTGELSPYDEFNALKKIGAAFFDNCFTLNFAECQPMCVLRDPIKKIQVEIRPAKSYPYLQIYTPPHRNSIAIENLSSAPDAFNNVMGLTILNDKEEISFETTYKVTSLT